MSRWLIVTVAGVVIAAAVTIVVMFFLIKKNEQEEKVADKLYLEQKSDLLNAAVKSNIDTSKSTTGAGALLEAANTTQTKVNKSTSALAGVVARQKSLLKSLKDKYASEKSKILSPK